MKKLTMFVMMAGFVLSACGGGAGSGVTVKLSPVSGSIPTLGASVTATFSMAITEPADGWDNHMTLTEVGSETNLCTTTYAGLAATCAHDAFAVSTTYILTVTGLTDANGTAIDEVTSTFTTTSVVLPTVSSMTKSTNTTTLDDSGMVALTFTLSSAALDMPTVEVTALAEGVTAPTTTCELDSAGTTLSCDVTGLQGCATFVDYQVTVSGYVAAEFTKTFNSADDEFDWYGTMTVDQMFAPDADTSGYCWRTSGIGTFTNVLEILSTGNLKISQAGGGGTNEVIQKIQGINGIAVTTYIAANVPPTDGTASTVSASIQGNGYAQTFAGYYGSGNMWAVAENAKVATAKSSVYGELANQIVPLYLCNVKYITSGTTYNVKRFIAFSTTGEWSEITASGLDCDLATGCADPATDIIDATFTATANDRLNVYNYNDSPVNSYSPEIGFVRANTNNITGVVADCPLIAYTAE